MSAHRMESVSSGGAEYRDGAGPAPGGFRADYGRALTLCAAQAGEAGPVPEHVVCCVWHDQLFRADGLRTDDGRTLRVISPGWWNRGEGPDFREAQLEMGGCLVTGDVEIHVTHGGWRQHGHHLDKRYDNVILAVALEANPPSLRPATRAGRPVPTLPLSNYIEGDIRDNGDALLTAAPPEAALKEPGRCAALVQAQGPDQVMRLAHMAGEWRILNKARRMQERMERAGADQAIYEDLFQACGYSRFKHHFRRIATSLPYDRARQLARQDALLLEAGLLQLAGLLPKALPEGADPAPHFARLQALREKRLPGLRKLSMDWTRVGVRPVNYPERRLAGAARLVARTAAQGLAAALRETWDADLAPLARRRRMEALFPSALGFWATRCTWTGNEMRRPAAPFGPGRVRSVIGNVFVPAALAMARQERDRNLEERTLAFFVALPAEPDNRFLKAMVPRFFGKAEKPRMDFRAQQGLLQLYQDWCEQNPSCRNCSMPGHLGLNLDKLATMDR